MSLSTSNLACAAGLGLCLFFSPAAFAEPGPAPQGAPSTSSNRQAVQLAHQGRESFQMGDYAQAIRLFRLAKERAYSPVFDLYIARSLKAEGELLTAISSYRRAALIPYDPDNGSWQRAYQEATQELKELERMVPQLTLIASAAPADVQIQIDGRTISSPLKPIALNPGKHELIASSESYKHVRSFALELGQQLELRLPAPRPPTKAAKRALMLTNTVAPGTAESSSTLAPYTWSALGLAAAALVVGGVAGGTVLGRASELKSHCRINPCPGSVPENSAQLTKLNEARDLANVADVAFVTAGIVALAGVTLLVLESGDESSQAELKVQANGLRFSGAF